MRQAGHARVFELNSWEKKKYTFLIVESEREREKFY